MFLHMSLEIDGTLCAEGAAGGEAKEGLLGFRGRGL